MRTDRSASQILFGYLPGQTVDLHGGVWKVKRWHNHFLHVDGEALRAELLRQLRPWEREGTDNGLAAKLRSGESLRTVKLDLANGIEVEPFPNVFQCRSCNRVANSKAKVCKCGANNWGQLPFVGFHECGALREPWVPRCPAHQDVKVVYPGSSDASQIRFVCPVCSRELRRGFGFPPCDECGTGTTSFNVHRASQVFAPRSVAVVNAMSPEKVKMIRSHGGPERALGWVLAGMKPGGWASTVGDKSTLVETLVAQGITREVAEQMASVAAESGETADTSATASLSGPMAKTALDQATTIASAVSESRLTTRELAGSAEPTTPLGSRYATDYPLALHRSGLEEVELIDRFPVLTGQFGYTRGSTTPGESRLRTWRDDRSRQRLIYADLQETEALFFRLDPERVLAWLSNRWPAIPAPQSAKQARLAILENVRLPEPGEEPAEPEPGSDLLTLLHSYSHRMIRRLSVFAGLDRNSLSEMLVPAHLGFFVYAAARGDFVLGGLQAVFETELDRLLSDFRTGEHRCAMDPGCKRSGGACVACLHLGEPSCRYFNRFLNRSTLIGSNGYLA